MSEDRTKCEDALISALLRASAWLDEAGHALKLQNTESRVARDLILEGGYARAAALDAMLAQNERNASPSPGALND